MTGQRKGEWALNYDDGSEKLVVSFDLTSERLPGHVHLGKGLIGDQWFYIDAKDVSWLCARLLDAAAAIGERTQ